MAEETVWAGMFAPLNELWQWVKAIVPKRLMPRKPRLNYITVHYLYILGSTITFSIIIYGYRNMPYIDALFFAGGTATQSGLNTIDTNLLKTYQQIVFYIGSSLCTPVFINTVVVFVRLYWFEKRFEHVVKESKMRRARTISRSRSQMRGDRDVNDVENGVNGREITMLPGTLKENGTNGDTSEERRIFREKHGLPQTTSDEGTSESSQSGSSARDADGALGSRKELPADAQLQAQPDSPSSAEAETPYMGLNPRLNRGITFADEVSNDGHQSPELARVPEANELSKHIEFIERQQADAKNGGAYYIPGPRDFEEGQVPEQLDQRDVLRRQFTKNSLHSATRSDDVGEERQRRGITIDEPDHPGHRSGNPDEIETAPGTAHPKGRAHTFGDAGRSLTRTWTNLTKHNETAIEPMPYFSWEATTGRNSTFLGLSQEQREELGGIEYRALKTLAAILLFYFFGFHILGLVVFSPWIQETQKYKDIIREQGQSPTWWGIFTPASLFNDLGYTITNNSMYSFNMSVLTLLFGSFLIIIGNTGFPCMLRFIIWVLSKIATRGSGLWEELRFLLDHPRRCFTLLFPSKATWWLFWVLVGLNGIDLIFFIILDLNDSTVTDLPVGYRILNGWFQAVSTRTAGFSSVNLAELHAAIQVSYLVMMYISVFPIAISVRRTNVYEEKSLGIFGGEEEQGDDEQSYVSQHLRRQLSFDLWYIFLGLFIITIVEGDRISNVNQPAFTTFSVLFEIVSAYGTVGLSLGYPNTNASFSGEFRTISKLIILAMMVRGRHRGLPYALDRAILLPSEKLQQKEQEDAERRVQRRGSAFAEGGEDFTSHKTWEDGELDASGLPRQHAGQTKPTDPMTAGAGGVADSDGLRRLNTKRSAALSTQSGSKLHQRSRSLGRLAAGALSAGPSAFPKRD